MEPSGQVAAWEKGQRRQRGTKPVQREMDSVAQGDNAVDGGASVRASLSKHKKGEGLLSWILSDYVSMLFVF